MKTITILIDKAGQVSMQTAGFVGQSCKTPPGPSNRGWVLSCRISQPSTRVPAIPWLRPNSNQVPFQKLLPQPTSVGFFRLWR